MLKGEEKIVAWLEKVKFRKQLLGGVKEQDVWKKIRELQNLYLEALAAERIRYDTLLELRSDDPEQAQTQGNISITDKTGEVGE